MSDPEWIWIGRHPCRGTFRQFYKVVSCVYPGPGMICEYNMKFRHSLFSPRKRILSIFFSNRESSLLGGDLVFYKCKC
jgi:hypothetical protein